MNPKIEKNIWNKIIGCEKAFDGIQQLFLIKSEQRQIDILHAHTNTHTYTHAYLSLWVNILLDGETVQTFLLRSRTRKEL